MDHSAHSEFTKLKKSCDALHGQYTQLVKEYNKLKDDKATLSNEYNSLLEKHKQLKIEHGVLASKYKVQKDESVARVMSEHGIKTGQKRKRGDSYADKARTAAEKKVHFDRFHKSDLRALGKKYSVPKYYTMTKAQLCTALKKEPGLTAHEREALAICNV